MNRLKEIRDSRGLSLEQLAKLLGVSRQAINGWEKGDRKIPNERKAKLSEIFGLKESDFDEYQDVMPKNVVCNEIRVADAIVEYKHDDDIDDASNMRLMAYYKGIGNSYVEIIDKLKERKAEQRKLVRKISKTILADDKAFMVDQIAHIEKAVILFDRFNQVIELLDSIDPANKDDYCNRIMEFLYAMEIAIDENTTIDKNVIKRGLKTSNIEQAKKLFKKALVKGDCK